MLKAVMMGEKLMPENSKPVRVAVNVMRARLTVIGFNIAIVSIQIAQGYRISGISGGVRVPGIDHAVHVGADMALFMALALSLIALVAFITSSAFDEIGVCTHWSLVAGDLLMYLALAHTVAGFFGPWNAILEIFPTKLPDRASEIATLHAAMAIAGGAAWFLATYAGPVVSLVRSPFQRRTNIVLGIAYIAMLLALAWVSAQAARVETLDIREAPSLMISVLRELVQPFRW
jgi:hypothetical protein